MSTSDPFAFLEKEPRPVAVKKPHWREKLFSKEREKDKEKNIKPSTTDQQIEAFLSPVRSKSVSHALNSANGTARGYQKPRLDTSHRWPSAQDVLNATSPISKPASATEIYPPTSFPSPPRKTRARKGLKVRFSDKDPEVIGEGGDETEAPTIEISLNRGRRAEYESKAPQLQLDTSLGDTDGVSQARTPQRKDTSEGINTAERKPLLVQSPQDSEFLLTLNLGGAGSRLSFRASPESNSFAQRVRAKMQAEEGRALQHGCQDYPSSPEEDGPLAEKKSTAASPESPNSLYETPPVSETEPSHPALTLRIPANSSTHKQGGTSPIELNLPAALTSGPELRSLSPPKPQPIPRNPVQNHPVSRDARDTTHGGQLPKASLRSLASQVGDTAFTDLKAYVAQYSPSIRVAAETGKPSMEISLAEWIRAAVWWFLRGKKKLEVYARSRSSSSGGRTPQGSSLGAAKQAVVDLGKALWICENVVPQHSELSRYGTRGIDAIIAVASTTGNKHLADCLSLHQAIISHLRSLAMSIRRNNILSELASEGDAAVQPDTNVWVGYPVFAPDVSAVLSGAATRSVLVDNSGKGPSIIQMMPLGDTSRYFSYGSMFVEACISSQEDDSQEQFSIPCALSILRDRGDWYVFAAITSQSELVNVMIQSDRKKGPTWDDVEWHVRSHSMRVRLPRGFELDVSFQDEDFKNLWNIVHYTLKTEASLQPEAGETVIFEYTLKNFQYMDSGTPKAFPTEPVERCRLRLFERSETVTEGTGSRSAHRGFRLTVLTSPKVKTLSSVRHIIGHGAPIIFGLLRGEDGAPALMLKVKEDGRSRSMVMTFQEVQDRNTMHALLLGMTTSDQEFKIPDISLQAYSIEQPADKFNGQPVKVHLEFPAGNVSVIDQERAYVDHGYGPTVLSEHLRAFIATEWGSVTDRLNLGPGELKMGLDVNNRTGFSLYRPAQQDLTVSIAENLVPAEVPDKIANFMQIAMVKPMVRRFEFASLKDLHTFQAAVTGFNVLFDGVASSFMISRRRMVVPIYKKWEASLARLQIVQQEKVVQLVAFLADFNHGRCMNFVLKGTDTLESFGRSGKFCIRLVDAKFALPKTEDDPASDFVCLDMLDYPSEHDDITIAFDSEADRSAFQAAVPGTVHDELNVVTDVAPPLHVSTTFRYSDNPDELVPLTDLSGYDQEKTSHVYSRLSAPNPTRFEVILSSLLNGEAISYSSGLSALNAALVLLNPRRIAIGNGYHGCHGVIEMFGRLTGLQKLDLDCPAEQLEAGDVILLETPVNPQGTAFNIAAYADKAHSRGAYLIVDSTFAPPGLQDPFIWGADLIMHSGSKYFGGHSDVLCGVLATQRKDWAKKLFQDRLYLGSVMGNMESWLGVRSLRTLDIRVQRQSSNAANLVSWLDKALRAQNPAAGSDEAATQAALEQVFHASLQKEDEEWLLKQMPNGFGPVFSITMKEEDYARKLPSKLSFFHHATSLGGVETLIEWRTMTDATVDRRLLRISVGLENWEDLKSDLVNAFRALIGTK
ncbi:hypothetical protein CNMCM8812_001445 [Aspergillus fumigatus]|nr:hypothetical protein CNMCM8714_005596 [Aspergillus fumigatus]KAF4270950.1 hypothetical protein CNMCM8057_007508 [Aspergillus fumigatus]KAF4275474.1 hypothetical protein CNMCM8812_001445 [Aspergillus fumigatus]KAH1519764.1 hypothetical protein KXX29_005960 [Aspergillus fumigatus]KAH1579929.1 hypothetical protein KXX17_004167 [Aspergillus fumigatus]